MARHKNKPLDFKQYRAVILLAGGDQVKEVAAKLGVNRETIRRWRRNPKFQKECADYVERLFASALCEAQAKFAKAIGWLEEAHEGAEKYGDKIKVAAILLNAALKSHELAVLKNELAKLRHLKDLVRQLMQGGGTTAPSAAFPQTAACESDCSRGQDDPNSPGV